MTSVLKTAKLLFIATIICFVMLTVITLITNMDIFDEELNPELVSLLEPDQFIPDSDNGYVYFVGLLTSQDKDPLTVGSEYIDILSRYSEGDSIDLDKFKAKHFPSEITGAFNFNAQNLDFECDYKLSETCLKQYTTQYTKVITSKSLNKLLLERYSELVGYQDFQEKPELGSVTEIPPYQPVLLLSKNYLAFSYQESPAAFLQALKNDMAFWKTVARQSNTLIAKLVAFSSLENHIYLASLFIQDNNLTEVETLHLKELLSALTMEQFDIAEAFISEEKWGFKYMQEIEKYTNSLLQDLSLLFLQRNATSNQHYNYVTKPLLRISKLSTRSFYEQKSQCLDRATCPFYAYSHYYSYSELGTNFLYNPIGKKLNMAAIPNYSDYIEGMHQVATYLNLVRLQLEIASSPEIPADDIVKQSTIKNPITGQPMDIDTEKRVISYQCGDKSKKCTVNY
jgi:hypothetical protein